MLTRRRARIQNQRNLDILPTYRAQNLLIFEKSYQLGVLFATLFNLLEAIFPATEISPLGSLNDYVGTWERRRAQDIAQYPRQAQQFVALVEKTASRLLNRQIQPQQLRYFSNMFKRNRLSNQMIFWENFPLFDEISQNISPQQTQPIVIVPADQVFSRTQLQNWLGQRPAKQLMGWSRQQYRGHLDRISLLKKSHPQAIQMLKQIFTRPFAATGFRKQFDIQIVHLVSYGDRQRYKIYCRPLIPQPYTIDFSFPQANALKVQLAQVIYPVFMYLTYPFLVDRTFRNHGGLFTQSTFQNAASTLERNQITIYAVLQTLEDKPVLSMPIRQIFDCYAFYKQIISADQGRLNNVILNAYLRLSRELIRRYIVRLREWQALQKYAWIDQNNEWNLAIKYFQCTAYIYPICTYIPTLWDRKGPGQACQSVLDTMPSFYFNTSLKVGDLLKWQFFSSKKRVQLAQFKDFVPQCVSVANNLLLQNRLPYLMLKENQHVQNVIDYCQLHSLGLFIAGYGVFNEYCIQNQPYLSIGPKHIEFCPRYLKKPFSSSVVATFLPENALKHPVIVDKYGADRVSVANWKIGDQLPLDKSLNCAHQISLRKNVGVIDIEALAVTGQRQTPYMICAVVYPVDTQQMVYRCWSNVEVQHYSSRVSAFGQKIYLSQKTGYEMEKQCAIFLFVEWLTMIVAQYSKKDPLILWGYNMMGYQIAYLLPQLTKQFGWVDMQGGPSQCKSFNVGGRCIIFNDILKILNPQKLSSACKEFDVVIKKEEYDISLVKKWEDVKMNYEKIK